MAEPTTLRFGSQSFAGMVYNGDYAGPTLRVRPGDTMRVKLVNHLAEPTNLHFHGLQTSPLGNSDNMFVLVPPGDSFDYEVLVPGFQPPGLYWYHSHLHGNAEKQVTAGLSGALIVEGFETLHPGYAGVEDRVLVLKDIAYDDDDDDNPENFFRGLVQTVNGQTLSKMSLKPGETQLWRFSNQASNFTFHLRLEGHKFRIVGQDGIATPVGDPIEVIDIHPAARIEAIVEGGAPGNYRLLSEKVLTGGGDAQSLNRALAEVTVAGRAIERRPEPSKPVEPVDLRALPIDAKRRFVFSQVPNDDKQFFLNGQLFDHDRIDTRVPLGSVEEWTIKNESNDLHVFHIHQLSFQVVEINGKPLDQVSHLDVVKVPERGEVKLRLAFTNPLIVGKFMYHCHILKHEDRGMMAVIEVYDPRNPGAAAPEPTGAKHSAGQH